MIRLFFVMVALATSVNSHEMTPTYFKFKLETLGTNPDEITWRGLSKK